MSAKIDQDQKRQIIIGRIEAMQTKLFEMGVPREDFDRNGSIDYLIDVGIATKAQIETRKNFLAWENRLKELKKNA